MLSPRVRKQIEALADEMAGLFTPPELIAGCEVLSVDDKDQYASDNGWIEARAGQHNRQRCRWRGQFNSVQVGDFVDVLFFASYRLFVVFGQGGTGAAAGPLAHNLLSANHPDTLADDVVAGDVIIGNATPKWARLAKGDDGQVLTLASGLPVWAAAGSGGWPFSQELTVDPTDTDADHSTISAAITAASSGFLIAVGVATYNEAVTINKLLTVKGRNANLTIISQSVTITTATGSELENVWALVSGGGSYAVSADVTSKLTNIRADHVSVANARGVTVGGGTEVLLSKVLASSNGSTTSRALEVLAGTVYVDALCDFEALGAGTKFDVFVDGGATCRLNGPILRNGTIGGTGTVTGWYRDRAGNVYTIATTGQSGGVWRYRADGLRIKYDSLTAAASAAAAGDVIHLFPGTYTLTSQLAYGAAFAIEGEGPETIINCATNGVSLLLLNSAGAALRNLKITHSGAGILNSGVYITANATVENVTVTLSGAATANYAVLQQGGTATLINVNATASGATTNHSYRNDTGDATVTINGGSYSGTQADIYGERAASTLTVNDPVLVNGYSDWDGDVSGQYFGTKLVTNTSGATALGRDVGYIDSNGDYVTTTTANTFTGSNCVVVISGGSTLKCFVATAGRWPVRYAGSAPNDGDFLVTSTTAGAAAAQATMRPEIFARCQAAGASNVVTALLLTGTDFIPYTSANNIYNCVNASTMATAFAATIASLPGGAVLTYTPTAGNEDTLVPSGTLLSNLILYNTTRGTSALISSVVIGTNTITLTANVPAGWVVTDVITARGQTCTSVAISDAYEYQITSAEIPTLTRALQFFQISNDTGATAQRFATHPYATLAASKLAVVANYSTTISNSLTVDLAIIDNKFAMGWLASGAATQNPLLRLRGYYLAVP